MPLPPDFDLYEALEISRDASTQDITASYRRLARFHHPDKNPDNASATAKFQKCVSHASYCSAISLFNLRVRSG
ncbi:hypothetical protein QC760_010586 [Botrytis cinerea]